MENVIITETNGGNPKYIMNDLNVSITALKYSGAYNVTINHADVSYSEITGRQIENDRHDVYIKSVSPEEYPIFIQSLIHQIRRLAKMDVPIKEIIQGIYNDYHGINNATDEIIDIQNKIKELNIEIKQKIDELNELSRELDYIYKQMEML